MADYVDLLKRLESVRCGIAQVRDSEELYLNRQQYYPEVLEYIDGLRDLVATLEQADPLIRMKSRKRAVHFYLMLASLVATILGILISLALFLLK